MTAIAMKAIKTFSGREGLVRSGREFAVSDVCRAADLEHLGNAVPIRHAKCAAIAPTVVESVPVKARADEVPAAKRCGRQSDDTDDSPRLL